MTVWILFLIGMNFGLVAAVVVLWIKMNRPQKDDPRLSKGLQLLQSKIAVLEDLSDRSESQVQQLVKILDGKVREIQSVLQKSDENMVQIERSMEKSLEVAEIFEDRIPHEEIIERQNSKKYLQAAQLAFQGQSVAEISKQVDLSHGEIEMIAKLNRDELIVDVDALPQWAKLPKTSESAINPFSEIVPQSESSQKIKQEFKQVCEQHENEQKKIEEKYQAFPKIEPAQFRKQMQSFVENVLGPGEEQASRSAEVSKTPVFQSQEAAVEGVEWLENQTGLQQPATQSFSPPAAPEQKVEPSFIDRQPLPPIQPQGTDMSVTDFEELASESNTSSFKKRAFEYVDSLDAVETKPPAVKLEPEKVKKIVDEITREKSEKRVTSEITAELLKKVAAKDRPKKPDKFIRSENTGEVKLVKFPRLDIGT